MEFVAHNGLYFLFEQSTRKCKWESYDGRDEFWDPINAKQVMGHKIGCGSQLVDIFVKQHIHEMSKKARERGQLHSIHPCTDELVCSGA
jgi:hypothetical protein